MNLSNYNLNNDGQFESNPNYCAICAVQHDGNHAPEYTSVRSSDFLDHAWTPGQEIKVTFDIDVSALNSIGAYGAFEFSGSYFKDKMMDAFGEWSEVCDLTFVITDTWADADVSVYWHSLDGPGGVLGYALPLDDGNGLIERDKGEGVLIGMDLNDALDFDTIALHEVGHVIGLAHNTHTSSLMAPYLGSIDYITDYDKSVAVALYGEPGSNDIVVTEDPEPVLPEAPETIIGGSGADDLAGTSEDDIMAGGSGIDTLSGGSGSDVIYGNIGTDLMYGGDGNDTLFGGQNNGPADSSGIHRQGTETISGGAGDDLIYGNMGADFIIGGDGNDTIFGGQDIDAIVGWSGNDVLYGNKGYDLFAYYDMDNGDDTIVGFTKGSDRIALVNVDLREISVSGSSSIVTLSTGDTVTLQGVTGVTESNFSFW